VFNVLYCLSKGDSLTVRHVGQKFSTRDQDNDEWPQACALFLCSDV